MAENQLDRLFSRSCPPRSVGPPAARASGERRLRLRQLRAFRPPRRPCPEISTGSCLLTIGSTPATSQEATRPQQSRQLKWLYASCFSLPKLAFQIRSPLFRAGCAWIFAAAPSKTPRGAHKKLIRLILCVKINWGFARNKRVSVYLPERSRSRAELAASSPTVAARHVGRRCGLVDEHQFQRIEIELTIEPPPPPFKDVGPVLFARVRRLFLNVMSWRSKNRQIIDGDTFSPRVRSKRARISASVRSGSRR